MEALRTASSAAVCRSVGYLMTSMYSTSLPLLSRHLRYMTDASTLAGEKVLGSLSSEMTLSRIVLSGADRGKIKHTHTPEEGKAGRRVR